MGVSFKLNEVPFSFFGSWMSLSIPAGHSELYFRNHHFKSHDLFALQGVVNGRIVPLKIDAQPACLVLTAGEAGRVEICFESPHTVRMRGQGMGLRCIGKRIHAYRDGPGLAVFNFRSALRRYQFEILRGQFRLAGAYAAPEEDLENMANLPVEGHGPGSPQAQPDQQSLTLVPDPEGVWELAIDEFWSTWRRPGRKAFEDCLASARTAFAAFLDSMPPAPPSWARARELAAYINWSCTMSPCGLVQRPTIFMSKNWMTSVWSWDQCFNAMALASGQPELAMDQMLTLVDHQDEFGAYTDAFNDVEKHYNYAKPPIHGFTLGEIRKRLPRPLKREVVQTMYESLSRQAGWWMTDRCRRGEGLDALPYYLHGNDSGWDNSTMFAKGVPLVAPDLVALLILQMEQLADLAGVLDKADEASAWRQRADGLFQGMMAQLWRGDHFVARLANGGADVECRSLIPMLPLILGHRLAASVRECLKTGMEGHLTEWGLATERVDSACYVADGYWRGPIWAPSTFLAVVGLDRCGYTALADQVALRFCKLCDQSGFAENFDACTGQGLRDRAYTWTASVFLLLAQRLVAGRGPVEPNDARGQS